MLLVLVAAALGTFSVLRRPAERPRVAADASGQPATWRLAGESLTVFDATGALVFEHPFGFSVADASSADTREYWSNGYIDMVVEEWWAGRPVVLVGAANNDFRAASLAVFPPGGVSGSAPAARPAYACRNCPSGRPEAFFLFPTLCITRPRGQAVVFDAWVERGDRLRVNVEQGDSSIGEALSYYTLGPEGALLGSEISREFQAAHALLERRGLLDHPFGAQDDRDMFPVRRWDGRRFVELTRVKVAH